MGSTSVKAGDIEVRLEGGGEGFSGSLSTSALQSGVDLVHLKIAADEAGYPP